MERESSQIPIHLTFGRHEGRPGLAMIAEVESKAREFLRRSPQGCVVIFHEDAASTHQKARVLEAVSFQPNITPLDAMGWYYFRYVADRNEATKAVLERQGEFQAANLKSLDGLFRSFPERVGFVIESGTEDEITRNFQLLDEGYRAVDQSFAFVDRGQFDLAVPKFQKGVKGINDVYEDRERRMILAIKGGAQERPNTIALVGFAGSSHLPIARSLQQQGFFVEVSIPEKEQGKFVFIPEDVASRMLRFTPKKQYTDNQWMQVLIADRLYHFLCEQREKPRNIRERIQKWYMKFELRHIKTDQDMIKSSLATTRGLTTEAIRTFEQSVKENGFPLAALKLMDSRGTKK